jgi:L-lactate dehydrogenase
MDVRQRKVTVVGAGAVGTTYIYALMQTAMASEIALIDIDEQRVRGEVMDLGHSLPFLAPVNVKAGSYEDCADSQLIVVTAGAKQQSGQSRTELIKKNAEIIKNICQQISKYDTDAVLVMVTNPVDTLTQLAVEYLGWPRGRVIGSGTVLDTARLKYMLSGNCDIDARNIHAYVIGEHGDSEVTPWSLAHIAGVEIKEYCKQCRRCDHQKNLGDIARRVRDSAYHIIDYKGATFYGIGLSLVRITGAILRDEKSVLTISTMLDGEYGLEDICLSVPCVTGRGGAESIIDAELHKGERTAFEKSAAKLRDVLASVRK